MNPNPPDPAPQITRYDAAAIADARGVLFAPASILIELQTLGPTVLALGTPDQVSRASGTGGGGSLPRPTGTVSLPGSILIPGLVNAHTHLDLTHIGPHPHDPDAGFIPWIDLVRAHRRSEDAGIAESVRRGVELSLAGGVVAVGDIAGAPKATPNLTPWRTLREGPLLGVSFVEFFGIGRSWPSQPERLERFLNQAEEEFAQRHAGEEESLSRSSGRDARSAAPDSVRLGLQPHAPTTVDIRLYEWTVAQFERRGLPLSTHLAETPEERAFVAGATGMQREFLERIGLWDESVLDHLGRDRHPVGHLAPVLAGAPFLAAHVNDATDGAIEALAKAKTSVAYCPRASDYFGAHRHFGPHRYRDMLAAGINVCLGTDSIVNLPADAADPERAGISTLEEMRFLYRRDGTDPRTLLAMATTQGARALGIDPERFLFKAGSHLAGLVAVDVPASPDPLRALLASGAFARLLLHANGSCQTRKTATNAAALS